MSEYGSGDSAWMGALVRHPVKRYGVIIDTEIREGGWRYLRVRWMDEAILETLAGDGDVPPSEEWLRHNTVRRVKRTDELRIIDEARRYLRRSR